jgi:peptidoglycan/LPS O-acetylase OafA/YrhL
MEPRVASDLEPLVVLVFVPFALGLAAEFVFRDRRRAMFAAALATTLAVFAALAWLDHDDSWNWLAALLVSPLAITFALFAVIVSYGRSQTPRRRHGQDA